MGYMEDIREAIDKSSAAHKKKDAPAREASERVAKRLDESIIWPEKSLEVKRQKRINQVKEEASGSG